MINVHLEINIFSNMYKAHAENNYIHQLYLCQSLLNLNVALALLTSHSTIKFDNNLP